MNVDMVLNLICMFMCLFSLIISLFIVVTASIFTIHIANEVNRNKTQKTNSNKIGDST